MDEHHPPAIGCLGGDAQKRDLACCTGGMTQLAEGGPDRCHLEPTGGLRWEGNTAPPPLLPGACCLAMVRGIGWLKRLLRVLQRLLVLMIALILLSLLSQCSQRTRYAH